MPFCTQCGHSVSGTDVYCASCGARQSAPQSSERPFAPPPPMHDPLSGLSHRTASILCYVPAVGWIAAIIVLAARKFKDDRMIRFHAFQGLYLFAVWLVVDWVIGPIARTSGHYFPIDMLLHALILAVSIFMMVKASHDEAYILPIIGELAQKSAIEQ